MKAQYFEVQLRIEGLYWSDGVVKVEDDKFEGYLTSDYISGEYSFGCLEVDFQEYDLERNEVGQKVTFYTELDNFELPNGFYFVTGDRGQWTYLEIDQKAKISPQKFNSILSRIKRLHQISQ